MVVRAYLYLGAILNVIAQKDSKEKHAQKTLKSVIQSRANMVEPVIIHLDRTSKYSHHYSKCKSFIYQYFNDQ